MPSYLHPGVYVEEIPSGSRPIEGVGTSTAAFVGYVTQGPIGEPSLISKWDDYVKQYGGIRDTDDPVGDPMGFSVSAFFQNGGGKAYIIRITKSWTDLTKPTAHRGGKAVGAMDHPAASNTTDALLFTAANAGTWANGLVVRLESKPVLPGDDPLYTVLIGRENNDTPPEFFVAESFTNINLTDGDPMYITNVINGVSDLVTVELKAISELSPTVSNEPNLGTSVSGDLSSLSLPLDLISADEDSRTITLALDGSSPIERIIPQDIYNDLASIADAIQDQFRRTDGGLLSTAARQKDFTCVASDNRLILTSGTRTESSSVVVNSTSLASTLKLGVIYTATSLSDDLSALTLPAALDAIATGDRSLSIAINGGTASDHLIPDGSYASLNDLAATLNDIDGLSCIEADNKLVLTSDEHIETSSIVVESSPVAAILSLGLANSGLEDTVQVGGVETTGKDSTLSSFSIAVGAGETTLDDGENGQEPGTADYSAIFTKFLKIRDINMICLPGQNWPKDMGNDVEGQPVIDAAIGHALRMKNRMVIVDPPTGLELDTELKVNELKLPNKTYTVLYYPWTKVANPFYNAEDNPGAEKTVLVPPCGYAAGMWARIDGKRGVWKAPAGLETGLAGLAGLEYKVEDTEQDSLNPLGVNCLRSMPGPVIWGSRTLATKSDPEWRYVPVRRTAIMIEQSIYNGIQWAVFEPNDHRLWSALRSNIGGFMNGLFRSGAFQGEKASDAYFVRCGLDDTMTQAEIDAGQVIVVVGFAPLKPAEFVIVRIQQKVNQQ